MSNYSYEIENSQKSRAISKEPKLYPFDEIENSIDQHFLKIILLDKTLVKPAMDFASKEY